MSIYALRNTTKLLLTTITTVTTVTITIHSKSPTSILGRQDNGPLPHHLALAALRRAGGPVRPGRPQAVHRQQLDCHLGGQVDEDGVLLM